MERSHNFSLLQEPCPYYSTKAAAPAATAGAAGWSGLTVLSVLAQLEIDLQGLVGFFDVVDAHDLRVLLKGEEGGSH